jgi:hypothetical protein
MGAHSHNFVETYKGMLGIGADRDTDEKTVIFYLQKFSDDKFMQTLIPRLSEDELLEIFDLINRLMKNHLKHSEYHALFLKEEH